MLNNYEAVFIMTPVLSDQQTKEAVDKFKSVLTNGGAEIVHEENWGLRKLAYPVQHKSTGFYNLLQFKADPSQIIKFETELKRDERVLRWLTVSLDKHALEYAQKRIAKRNGQQAEAKPAEAEQETKVEPVENKEN
jgi:small subunit ribosomal protein S6